MDTNLETFRRQGIRNVAIIAHVYHGKTTMVDKLLVAAKQSYDPTSAEALFRLMDSGQFGKGARNYHHIQSHKSSLPDLGRCLHGSQHCR